MSGNTHNKKKAKKGGGTGRLLRILVVLIALAVFCYSAYQLFVILRGYHAAGKEYDELAEAFTEAADAPGSGDGTSEGETSEGTAEKETGVLLPDEELTEDAAPPLKVDFESLQKINPDVIGWLYVDALPKISYPILRGEDNDYYLHHTFRHEELFSGSIFMEYRNSADFSDPNTIIYGHNMKDQSMFGRLKKLREQKTYDEAPYFWILTPDGNYRYHIYAAYETPLDSDTYTFFYSGGDGLLSWEEKMQGQSEVKNDVPLSGSDHTVVLSTCTGNSEVRCVVLGKCVSSQRPPEPHVDPELFEAFQK